MGNFMLQCLKLLPHFTSIVVHFWGCACCLDGKKLSLTKQRYSLLILIAVLLKWKAHFMLASGPKQQLTRLSLQGTQCKMADFKGYHEEEEEEKKIFKKS